MANIIFDVLSKKLPPRIQMTSELMDAAKFICHEDVHVYLSPIYYALKGMSFYAFGEGYMVSILKTNLMTQWIDLWFGREHPLLKRRESAPVRDLLDEDDDSDEEEDDYVWFTGIDHALVSRASILESEICSSRISMAEGSTLPHDSLCTVERNVFWQAYSSVVGSSDRAVTDPAEAGSFVKAIEQLYRISKAGSNEAACRALNTIFNRMRTSRLTILQRGHVTLAGLLAWLSASTGNRQVRLPKEVERKI